MKLIVTFLTGFLFSMPFMASAQIILPNVDLEAPGSVKATSENPQYTSGVAADKGVGSGDAKSSSFQLVSCQGVDDPRTTDVVEVECDYNQIIATISRIIRFVLYLLIPIVLGMILWIGWTYVTANGDPKKLADAKSMVTPLLKGIFFIFAAYLIVYKLILGNLLDNDFGKNTDGLKKTDIINTGGAQ